MTHQHFVKWYLVTLSFCNGFAIFYFSFFISLLRHLGWHCLVLINHILYFFDSILCHHVYLVSLFMLFSGSIFTFDLTYNYLSLFLFFYIYTNDYCWIFTCLWLLNLMVCLIDNIEHHDLNCSTIFLTGAIMQDQVAGFKNLYRTPRLLLGLLR